MSAEYEKTLAETESGLKKMQNQLTAIEAADDNAERFVALACKYRDATNLTDEELRQFLEKVVIWPTEKDANGNRSRRIDICFSFIGQLLT